MKIIAMIFSFLTLSLILSGLPACTNDLTDDPGKGTPVMASFIITPTYPNLSFTRPVDFQHPGDNSNRVFVVEQRGVISVFEDDASVSDKKVFLDIESKVDDKGNEEGLLGLAFHPDYENNGYFYVNYTVNDPSRTLISRFQVSPNDPDQALADSEVILMSYEQPYDNHNGGQVAFGPDGYLYIAVGDGGSGGDPQGNGQNLKTLLGTILRIDVDHPADGQQYGIPADNPFANNNEGFREEIYAFGLRNPWRFSFDPETDWLWVGDVGQNKYEEVDIVKNGGNYGWNITEGFHCFKPEQNCDMPEESLPIWEYDHSKGDVSINGGFVYRGEALPDLVGKYIFSDYVSGRIWALDFTDLKNPVNTEILNADFPISSFGINKAQELLICGFDGKIYKLSQKK